MRGVVALSAVLGVLVLGVPTASAKPAMDVAASVVPGQDELGPDAEALAERFSPVVVVRDADDPCGDGEHYEPIAVDSLFGRDDVQLLLANRPQKAAPAAGDLAGEGEGTHLDLPGDPLKPGCGYSQWAAALNAPPTVYSRVATDPAVPGQLALQYWLFWPYNDWNDRHEGDWEMIQLNFDASTAADALTADPATTIFAQHEGGETAAWTDPKVHRDGDHIAVYPGQGSHASYYDQRLWFGKSAASGFGCDNTSVGSGVTARRLDPEVVMLTDQPWLTYTGRWGAQAPSFNNGPTGPNTKTQWAHPIEWSQDEGRPDAVELPRAPGGATKMFCRVTEAGSLAFIAVLGSPIAVGVGVVLALVLLGWLVFGTRWRSVDPTHLEQPRRTGEVLISAFGVLWRSPRLFLPLAGALLLALAGLRVALLWVNRPQPTGDLTDVNGAAAGPLAWFANATLGVLVVGVIVMTATLAMARTHQIAGRLPRQGTSLFARPVVTGAGLLLAGTYLMMAFVPLGLVVLAFWALSSPWAVANDGSVQNSLANGKRLTRGRRPSTAGLVAGIAFIVALGPMVGALLLLGTGLPRPLVWLLSSVILALASVWCGVAAVLALYSAEQASQPSQEPELVT